MPAAHARAWHVEEQAATQIDVTRMIFDVWGVQPSNGTAAALTLQVDRVNVP